MTHISLLPPEILTIIFKEVRLLNGRHQMLGAVSKQLLHFTRQNLFHDVVLSFNADINKFMFTVDSGREGNTNGKYLASLVESLEVSTFWPESREEALDQPLGLFMNLVNVKRAKIGSSQVLHTLILSSQVAGVYLPKLETLALHDLVGDEMHPLDPKLWKRLPRFQALTNLEATLDVDFHKEENGERLKDFRKVKRPTFLLSRITSLTLGGEIYECGDVLSKFMRMFSQLHRLNIEDWWGEDALSWIFRHEMSTLQHLTLARYLPDGILSIDDHERHYLLSHIQRVPNLVSLSLTGDILAWDTLADISHLDKLETLTLEDGVRDINVDNLDPLWTPAERPPNLKRIDFNFLDGKEGNDFTSIKDETVSEDDIGSLYRHATSKCGWKLPYWPENFSGYEFYVEDAQYCIKQASESNLQLNSSFLEAVRVQQEFDRQEKVVLDRVGPKKKK